MRSCVMAGNEDEWIEGRDYEIDEQGLVVFTRAYLLRRGHCCESGCRNCPYGFRSRGASSETDSPPADT